MYIYIHLSTVMLMPMSPGDPSCDHNPCEPPQVMQLWCLVHAKQWQLRAHSLHRGPYLRMSASKMLHGR